ncbi:limbic system-associated membrane protein-like [Diadema antillarum]|uniref:limbic system-associated membrane protein-like n=1 Tax=Diadema antillarum TaxID=105358 RepID=UPI003A88D8ED
MSCSLANGSAGLKVTWIKQEGPTVISYTQDPRIRILGDDLTTFDLHISSVKSRDAGTYLCQVNTSPEATKTVVLQIGRIPIIKSVLINNKTTLVETLNAGKTRLPTEISVDESAPALLDCLATAFPPPEVAWISLAGSDSASRARISRGDMIRGMRLVIGNVTIEDEGLYTCRASNGYGSVDVTVRLTVRYMPKIKPLPKAIHVGLGSYIRISCEADGVPAPKVSWSREDGTFVCKGRYLVIVHLKPSKYSNYVCSARNAVGTVTTSTEITGRPKAPKFLSPRTGSRRHAYKLVLDPNVGTPYRMPLRVDSFVIAIREHTASRENSAMVPSWYEQVIELEDGGTSRVEYVIRDLRADTSYEVMVRGRNVFGAGEGATLLINTSYADLTTPPGNQVTTGSMKSARVPQSCLCPAPFSFYGVLALWL